MWHLPRTNVASVGSVFNDTRKVKVLSLSETIKEIDVSSEGPSSGVNSDSNKAGFPLANIFARSDFFLLSEPY